MAYNVLKGIVEGSVDQHGDQEIGGVKIFKSTISASVFYDTDAQSPCATENNVAIKNLSSHKQYGLLTYQGDKVAKAEQDLTFDGHTLSTRNGVFGRITGSAGGLRDIPAGRLTGRVPAGSIEVGLGLEEYRRTLRVKSGRGITTDEEGTNVSVLPNGAVGFKNTQLMVDIENSLEVKERGQNLSDPDLLLVHDASRRELRHTSLQNLYDGYLKAKVPQPAGPRHSLQYRGAREFEGSAELSYDPATQQLSVKGTAKALRIEASQHLQVNGSTELNGAVYKAIKVISDAEYDFQDTDHTVLFDPTHNSITATLPPARDNIGRVITIKRIVGEGNKYRIRGTATLKIKSEGGLIDYSSEITLKSNYSMRTFHSDGNKWWIVGLSGT